MTVLDIDCAEFETWDWRFGGLEDEIWGLKVTLRDALVAAVFAGREADEVWSRGLYSALAPPEGALCAMMSQIYGGW